MNTNRRFLIVLPVVSWIFFATSLQAGDWPAWRGPAGTGVSTEKGLPTKWGREQNVKWHIALPERGNSTPIVLGDRVFVTQAVTKENWRGVMCFDRKDGSLVWKSGVTYSENEPTHGTNPYCSASPVTDGERVIVSYGSAGVACYDLDGKELWRRDLGLCHHIWGNAASPVIYGDLCILNFGPGERTFLIAMNKKNGETVWQVDEPGGMLGEDRKGETWVGSWSTPIVIQAGGRDELVMTFPHRVCGLDPSTGKEFWTCSGLGRLVYTNPIYGDGVIVAMGGFGGPHLAVRPGGSGDVTATHRLWQSPQPKQRIGSGVVHDGHAYILNEDGVAHAIDLKTGKTVWEERLTGQGTRSWGSMVLSEGKLFVINQSADTFVLKASPHFELLAVNSLNEPTNSSPAVSNGEILIRTQRGLWCVGEKPSGR